jgi:hypothetical protein
VCKHLLIIKFILHACDSLTDCSLAQSCEGAQVGYYWIEQRHVSKITLNFVVITLSVSIKRFMTWHVFFNARILFENSCMSQLYVRN